MNNEKKYQLKWSYDDTRTLKSFVVEKCGDVFNSVAVKFIISKKKKKIRYAMMYCNLSDCLAESIQLVENFIDEYGDIISEDDKDIAMPI